MRGYELCLILQPEISEEEINNLLNSVSELITKLNGSILKTEKWGKKNFKYSIKKYSKGHYCFVYFMGNAEILNSIERLVKFKEYVLRYNTIRLEKNFTIEEKEKSKFVDESDTKNINIEKKDNNDLDAYIENNQTTDA